MVLFNHSTRELTAKIVYYGPGLCGKTTNLRLLHERLEKGTAGRLLSLATAQDRTIYFDLLPVELGNIKGYTVRFQLCTVPGQVFYNETRKLVLRGVDGVVFVVDSQWSMLSHNLESFQNLVENLRDLSVGIESLPVVIQYNKRDLPGVLSVDALQESLGFPSYPFVEAVASTGQGVVETFKLVSKLTFVDLLRRLQRSGGLEAEFAAAAKPDPTEETVARTGPPVKPSSFAPDPAATPAAAAVETEQPFDTNPGWLPAAESDVFGVPIGVAPGPEPFAAPAPEAVATAADILPGPETATPAPPSAPAPPAPVVMTAPAVAPVIAAIAPDPAIREALDRQAAELTSVREALEAQRAALEAHRGAMESELEAQRNALDAQRTALEAQRDALRTDIDAQRGALHADIEAQRAALEAHGAAAARRHEELEPRLAALQAGPAEQASALAAVREELRGARADLEKSLEALASSLSERISALGADLFAAREEAARVRTEHDEAHRALAEKVDGGEQELARARAATGEAQRLLDERLGAAERRTRSLAESIRRALDDLKD